MAAVEGFERGYLGTLMRLTLLSPAMVEAILNWQLLDWVPVRLGGEDSWPMFFLVGVTMSPQSSPP